MDVEIEPARGGGNGVFFGTKCVVATEEESCHLDGIIVNVYNFQDVPLNNNLDTLVYNFRWLPLSGDPDI